MTLRRSLQLGFLGAVAALIAGRWLAVSTAADAWAAVLGVEDAHAAIRFLRGGLLTFALLSASAWCVGNLYFVYRAIGAVHVPRQVGNIEILEVVPRRYLLVGALGLGLALAIAVAHDADSWWTARALSSVTLPLGLDDPLLSRDMSYYLFALPWQRTLHTFATVLSGMMLVVVGLLYVAVGAVRRTGKRIRVNSLARIHIAVLLAAFAAALFWGYRLEPAEYVAGLHGVPYDVVLTRVRVPVARLLSALALIAFVASLLWAWIERAALPIAAWSVLGGASIVGHYIAPTFAAAVRTPDELAFTDAQATQPVFEGVAYGLPRQRVRLPSGEGTAIEQLLAGGAAWDGFAVTVALEHLAPSDSFARFENARLAGLRDADGRLRPIYLSARSYDLEDALQTRSVSWRDVHIGAFATSHGVYAVAADTASAFGGPLFLRDPGRRADATEGLVSVSLDDTIIRFAPGFRDFAVLPQQPAAVRGVEVTGLPRRLGLAWVLQSSQVLSADRVPAGAAVLWDRDVGARLARYAPFVRWGLGYPAVVDRRLYWIASGYLAAAGFPGTRSVGWRGERVRYLRASVVGVVDAATGATHVYLLHDPDPLARAWAALVPSVLQPTSDLPAAMLEQLRYPAELLTVQQRLITQDPRQRGDQVDAGVTSGALGDPSPFWWVGSLPTDSVPRLRRVTTVRRRSDPATVFLDGTVRRGRPVIEVVDVGPVGADPRWNPYGRRTGEAGEDSTVFGPVRSLLTGDGLVHYRSSYAALNSEAVPVLLGVEAYWNGALVRGDNLTDVARQLATLQPRGTEVARWEELREWFVLLDDARRRGDWEAFGEAYGALQEILGLPRDTLP